MAIANVWDQGIIAVEDALKKLISSPAKYSRNEVITMWKNYGETYNKAEAVIKNVSLPRFPNHSDVISDLLTSSQLDQSIPMTIHDRVLNLLKQMLYLKEASQELFDEIVDEQFMIQVLWADVASISDERYSSVTPFNTVNFDSVKTLGGTKRRKLVLTENKLQKLERSLSTPEIAYRHFLVSANKWGVCKQCADPDYFFIRWKELSHQPLEVKVDEVIQDFFLARFASSPLSPGNQLEMNAQDLFPYINEVDHFYTDLPLLEIAEGIINSKDEELVVLAARKGLITPKAAGLEVEKALELGMKKIVPYLIYHRYQAGGK